MERKKLARSAALIILAVMTLFCGCRIGSVKIDETESSIEFSKITPPPMKTVEATLTPAPTSTPIPYDYNAVKLLLTKGTYEFCTGSQCIAAANTAAVPELFGMGEDQNFMVEKDSATGYCTISSVKTGLYLGINMKGQDVPDEGMGLTMMGVYSDIRCNWIIEKDGENCIIRSAYAPDYVVTLIPASTEDEKEIPASLAISQYTGSENQHWSAFLANSSSMLDRIETEAFLDELIESKYAMLGSSYSEVKHKFGSPKVLYVKTGLPVLYGFDDNPGVYYSFYGEVTVNDDHSIDDYLVGFEADPDALNKDHSGNDVCTGVYNLPVSAVSEVGEKGMMLSIALTKPSVTGEFYEHCYTFNYKMYIVTIECNAEGVITADSRIVISER